MADNFLSQEEVDALLKGVNDAPSEIAVEESRSGAQPYNLATQDRIVRGRMPKLDFINERFARQFSIGLSGFLRRGAEITIGPLQVAKYSEFLRNLAQPASLNLVHMKPLRGSALMVFDPSLVFLLVDNLFGGDGRFQAKVEGRDFTQTEQRIIKRVLDIVFETYAASWEQVYPIAPEHIRAEVNPQYANIAMQNEVVVSTAFSIALGTVSGEMHICMPYSMIEPIRDLLGSAVQTEAQQTDQRWLSQMQQQIQAAEVQLVADLGTADSTLRAILNMKKGDVIPIGLTETVHATVDGVAVMECTYGKLNGQYALRVERLLTNGNNEFAPGDRNG
jgi:flagellar motor switch protein FliM